MVVFTSSLAFGGIMKILLLSLILSLKAFASDYQMVGTYLLEYSIFKIDVYQISYFKNEVGEKLVLDYKTDVKRKYSQEGWKVGLKHFLEEEKYKIKTQWLIENTVDVKSGDQLSIVRKQDSIEIYKNNELVAKTQDADIAKLAFEPWLGERPVSEELKKALLNI